MPSNDINWGQVLITILGSGSVISVIVVLWYTRRLDRQKAKDLAIDEEAKIQRENERAEAAIILANKQREEDRKVAREDAERAATATVLQYGLKNFEQLQAQQGLNLERERLLVEDRRRLKQSMRHMQKTFEASIAKVTQDREEAQMETIKRDQIISGLVATNQLLESRAKESETKARQLEIENARLLDILRAHGLEDEASKATSIVVVEST